MASEGILSVRFIESLCIIDRSLIDSFIQGLVSFPERLSLAFGVTFVSLCLVATAAYIIRFGAQVDTVP